MQLQYSRNLVQNCSSYSCNIQLEPAARIYAAHVFTIDSFISSVPNFMRSTYIQYVVYLHTVCDLHTYSIWSAYIQYVVYIHTVCGLHTYSIFSTCIHYATYIHTVGGLHTYSRWSTYIQQVDYIKYVVDILYLCRQHT